MITKEAISSFDPFKQEFFSCPVCGSKEFVELYPYGGVWCAKCNAGFGVTSTCDGKRKIGVHCTTKHCWSKEQREEADRYFTTIWEDDKTIGWFKVKDRKVISYPRMLP